MWGVDFDVFPLAKKVILTARQYLQSIAAAVCSVTLADQQQQQRANGRRISFICGHRKCGTGCAVCLTIGTVKISFETGTGGGGPVSWLALARFNLIVQYCEKIFGIELFRRRSLLQGRGDFTDGINLIKEILFLWSEFRISRQT
jgi:hypothetical protein